MTFPNSWFFTMILCNLEIVLPGTLRQYQGLVKGSEPCLNPYFLAGCRSTLSMSKIKVKIFETEYPSFYNTLSPSLLGLNWTTFSFWNVRKKSHVPTMYIRYIIWGHTFTLLSFHDVSLHNICSRLCRKILNIWIMLLC